MDNCNYNLSSNFTRFGANDTTNCQLKINKDTFNRYEDTLTQKQIYSNIANRTVRNFSVCIPDISSGSDSGSGGGGGGGGEDGATPLASSEITETSPHSHIPPNNDLPVNSFQATKLVSEFHPDQIPEIVVENSYPSCSYKPIKF